MLLALALLVSGLIVLLVSGLLVLLVPAGVVVHHLVADGATLADAWEATSAARPEARPIPAFRAQLCKAEARIHGGAQTTDETLARAQHPQRGKRNSLTKDGCVVA